MDYFLGLDLGTTRIKCSLIDEGLNVAASACEEYSLIMGNAGEVEQNSLEWVSISLRLMRQVISSIGPGNSVRSLAVSSQGITVVPVDKDGIPLYNALSWLDTRGKEYFSKLLSFCSEEELYLRTGKRLNSAYSVYKILWLMEHRPEICEKTAYFLSPLDFLCMQFTGQAVTDPSMASGTGLYNIQKQRWDKELCSFLNIDVNKLPKLIPAGLKIAPVKKEILSELGLSSDVFWVQGGQDQKCQAWGAGLDSETLTLSLGTSSAIESFAENPPKTLDEIPYFAFLDGEKYVIEGAVNTSGAALQWFKNNFTKLSYEKIDELISSRYPQKDDLFFFPLLSSSEEGRALSAIFYGLHLDSGVTELALSVAEGVVMEIAIILEHLSKMTSNKAYKAVRVFGGGGKSRPWCQMLADTLNIRVETIKIEELGAYAAACLALRGHLSKAGDHKSCDDADYVLPANQITIENTYFPNPENASIMKKRLKKYSLLRKRLFNIP